MRLLIVLVDMVDDSKAKERAKEYAFTVTRQKQRRV
jgi:hypothetical protein